MSKEVASSCDTEDHNIGNEINVEHCFFRWTVKAFLDEFESSKLFETYTFSACGNDECFTLWQINLIMDVENDIQIHLTRLKSQNTALVFVRFHWEILDTNGNKAFPGSIHAFAYSNCKVTKNFVEINRLLEDKPRFLPDGNLHVLCEMSVYERTLEEQISMLIKGNIPHFLNGITEDLEELFETKSGADLCVRSADSVIRCHKSILSVRSRKFAELIEKTPKRRHLDLSAISGDVLHAIMMHIYLGSLDMYMAHTIPKDLYSAAEKFGLKHLQQHLDCVNSNGLTTLKSLEVTWKLPFFKILILQPKVTLYCPEPNTNTFYDKRWCFKLEFDSSSEDVYISVVRKQAERSTHFVKFIVQVESFGKTAFKKLSYLVFDVDETQGIEKFMTKSELSEKLSFEETLVLKCSLEVLQYIPDPSGPQVSRLKDLIEQFSDLADTSILKLTQNFRRMYIRRTFSDAVAYTRLGRIRYHSFLARTRYALPEGVLKKFLRNLNSSLVNSFFLFLYGGDIVRSKALGLKRAAERSQLQSMVEKFQEFELFYHA